MNVNMANQILIQASQAFNEEHGITVIDEVKQVGNGIFVADGITDVLWLNAGKCAFELLVLNYIGLNAKHHNDVTLTKLVDEINSDQDAIELINADVDFNNSQISFEVIKNINTLLSICGDDATMQRLFQIVVQRIINFEKTNIASVEADADDLFSDNAQEEGTRRIRRLIRKYGFNSHIPYVFEASEEPHINIKRLEKWALRNKIIVSVRRDDDGVTCNIEQCYFDLYRKIFD